MGCGRQRTETIEPSFVAIQMLPSRSSNNRATLSPERPSARESAVRRDEREQAAAPSDPERTFLSRSRAVGESLIEVPGSG
jgi:hypothetical protein